MEGLRFRLRAATALAHARLEAAIDIGAHCTDRGAYRGLIARFLGIYAPLEAALGEVDWAALNIDFAVRSKVGWLIEDLTLLGLGREDIASLPRAQRLPTIKCPADALGVLYVMEGASLGGQIISRQLETQLAINRSTGGRFFSSYGSEVGDKWRAYVATLETFGGSPAIAMRIERAALETFACFEAWLGAAVAATSSTGGDPHPRVDPAEIETAPENGTTRLMHVPL